MYIYIYPYIHTCIHTYMHTYIYHVCRPCMILLHVPHFVSLFPPPHSWIFTCEPGKPKPSFPNYANCDGSGAVVGLAPSGLHWKMCQRPLAALLLHGLQGMGFF